MKIVINGCYGGFCLSPAAMKRLVAEKSPGIRTSESCPVIYSDFKDVGDEYMGGYGELYKDGVVYTYDSGNRTCPILVSVVEDLGEAANGEGAELEVVEIPDGVFWDIRNRDGMESIEEEHRTWP